MVPRRPPHPPRVKKNTATRQTKSKFTLFCQISKKDLTKSEKLAKIVFRHFVIFHNFGLLD